jgi:polysaccharide biosynthesis protein PslG
VAGKHGLLTVPVQTLVGVVAVLSVVLGACAPATPVPAPASSPGPVIVTPLPTQVVREGMLPSADPAVHLFLWGNPATTERDLTLAREAGFQWVKQRFEWRNIEKRAKGEFEWHEPDRIVEAIEAYDLKIVARVDNQPEWSASGVIWPATAPPDDLSDWTDYLTALATRYRGRIHAYEIWNEPNIALEWGDRTPNPVDYTRMLQASYRAIKAADPSALVITAGMAPTTDVSDKVMRDIDFYRAMYAAGARGSFDLLGVHAAGFKAAPCADPGEVAADPVLTNGDQSPADVRRVYSFRHVEDVRQVMVENGDADKQVAILEMGWTTDRRPDSNYAWHAVDEHLQAEYLVDAFRCAREHWAPWVGFMTVIYIPDPRWTAQMEQFWWSITNPNGVPRPAYLALKAVLRP